MRYELRLENVTERYPVEKAEQRFESHRDQTSVLRVGHDEVTQREYLLKFVVHGLFEVFGLGLCHLTAREVEYFLALNRKKNKNWRNFDSKRAIIGKVK